MTDLERLRDDDGALGAAFRSAEYDAPKAGATAALLTALSLGAVGAVGAASATAAATAASTTATSVGAASSGAAGAAIKTSTFAAAWKLFAVSAVVVSGAVASVHVATRDLAAPSTTPSGTVLTAPSAKPAVAPRGYVAPQPIGALEAIAEPSATPALADPVVGSPMAAEPSPLAMRAPEPAAPREDSNGTGNTATPQLRVSPPSAAETSALGATEAPAPNASAASIVPAASVVPAASAAAIPKDEPPRALPNTHSNTRVADEVSALDGARSLLSSGRPAEALSALTAYEKAFPRPVLGEEALALKVEALVRAGRLPEAASLGNAFLERSPSSPVASRVRRSLAAAKQ
jgi:hypothetical protein